MRTLPLLTALAAALAVLRVLAAPLDLQDVTALPDQLVARGQAAQVAAPSLPAKAGQVTVLAFRAVITAAGPAGCNYNLSVQVNDQRLERYGAAEAERLIGRSPTLELLSGHQPFPVFGGERLMMMFARDTAQGDTMTADGLGATFLLDITDLARGVDGNTLSFRNGAPGAAAPGLGQLQVTDLRVGYLDRAKLPPPVSLAPKRGAIAGELAADGLRLAQSTRGGFSLRAGDGELLVETALGMKSTAEPLLVADDAAPAPSGVKLSTGTEGARTLSLQLDSAGLHLERTLTVREGLLRWREKWTNRGAEAAGVPFRHRFFLRTPGTQFRVGGSQDNGVLRSSPCNPTLYLQGRGAAEGFGITAESDWLRLLTSYRGMDDLGEIYSDCLALAPGGSIEFELTVTPVGQGGGYWSFLNGLRRRWGVNNATMPRAMFWGYARAQGATPEEVTRKSLGHLGPIIVTIGPWQRLEPDARVVTAGRYPRLKQGAPPTPGKCPDLDLEAFLTFAHREPYWENVRRETERLHALPGVQVIEMIHPAMEAVYKPLQDRWPIAPDAIRTAQGDVFEDYGYSKSWVGDYVNKDWGVLYYCPHDRGPQLQAILAGMRRGLQECRLDGIYSDEFSFGGLNRGYSRYDYSRPDGYSADLDEQGKVLRQKTDNAMASEAAQLQITGECLRAGKFFLGNGGTALRSINRLPIQRFVEGGNGAGYWGQGQLSAVPLILGNMGDEKTTRGVFESVKLCLRHGSVYSPVAVNLLLEGDDNFVCKQYPLSIVELGPGFVIGKERIITTVSRNFTWPGAAGKVRLYRYNSEGTRIDAEAEVDLAKGESLAVLVPEGGLVIAELAR